MVNSTIVDRYRKWIIQRGTESFPVTENEEGNLEIESKYCLGRVNFYDGDVIELRIDMIRDNKTEFFLHFQLTDLKRAQDLYVEMEEAMRNLKDKHIVKILLSCTSGLTTSYYAELLNKAVETLSLNYSFKAVSFDKLEEAGKGQDLILLAPQVHYARSKVQEMFHDKIAVRNIPAQTFGKYDTGALIELVKGELKELEDKLTPKSARIQAYFETNKKILAVGYINGGEGDESKIIYRYYKNGNIECSGESNAGRVNIDDLEEVIDGMVEKCPEIETIGLALPGTIENGIIFLEDHPIHLMNVKEVLEERYHKDVFTFNDANMIVTGIYWLEDRYKSVVLFFLPNGSHGAGCGIVVNGHLIRGRQHVAGEILYIEKLLKFSKEPEELVKTADGTVELVGKSLVPLIATLGPEAIFVYSQKTPSVESIRDEVKQCMPEEYIPDLVLVNDIREYMMTGTFLRCIWKLDDIKRLKFGLQHNPYME